MIADRRYLAAQIKDLQLELSDLDIWINNPTRPFPGDALALADQLRWIALLMAEDEMPEMPK